MEIGKLYRVNTPVVTQDIERLKVMRSSTDDVVIFLGWRERRYTYQGGSDAIEAHFVVGDRSRWFRVSLTPRPRDIHLPGDMLQAKFAIPWLDEAKPTSCDD